MTEQFDIYERLYRAVYPPEMMPMFWKENGEISSAVFKDKRGLSVERAGDRDESKVVNDMHLFFYGTVVYEGGEIVNKISNLMDVLLHMQSGDIL